MSLLCDVYTCLQAVLETDLVFGVKAQLFLEVLDQQILQPLSNDTCRDQHQTVSRPLQLTVVERVQSSNRSRYSQPHAASITQPAGL